MEVADNVVKQVRSLCLALPEVTVRIDDSLTPARSTAHSFDVRRRSFCLLVAVESPARKAIPLLVLRADPSERAALLSLGVPFFAPRAGRDRIGVLLTEDTDWEEIRELVTESCRLLAPGKLTALLDEVTACQCTAFEMPWIERASAEDHWPPPGRPADWPDRHHFAG